MRNTTYKVFIILIVSICGFIVSCTQSQTDYFNTLPHDILKEGDIVFRRGKGLASQFVLAADKYGIYSHTGIVVNVNDTLMILHAVPGEPDFAGDEDKVKIDDISSFFMQDRAESGAIMRIKNDTIAGKAAQKALKFYQRKTLFDHTYDLDDTTKIYCTQLIYHVYNQMGIDLTEGRRTKMNLPGFKGIYIFPSDIQKSSHLEIIYSF
ncbi:MAG: hypothetical protein LBV43_01765 [Prevotella sp.]|nr:hypothetical protein [Prevotella sp.]